MNENWCNTYQTNKFITTSGDGSFLHFSMLALMSFWEQIVQSNFNYVPHSTASENKMILIQKSFWFCSTFAATGWLSAWPSSPLKGWACLGEGDWANRMIEWIYKLLSYINIFLNELACVKVIGQIMITKNCNNNNKGSHPERKVQYFWTLFKNPLTPHHPIVWTLCGGVRRLLAKTILNL